MTRLFDYYALIVGRILIGGYFLWNGILLAINLDGTTAQFAAVHVGVDAVWIATIAIAIQVIGGIAIILDYKMRYATLAVALFLILVTVLFNAAMPDIGSTNVFIKNMALVGALLYISATSG